MTVLDHNNYRSFLAASVERQKQKNPLWSYASFARALGLKSAASIHKIVRGTRDPSLTLTVRLASYFEFTAAERAHFVGLVLAQRAGKRGAKVALATVTPATSAPTARTLTEPEFNAISGWWFYAIRQMARLPGFQDDPSWVQKRLLFPARRVVIRRALAVMKELGLLTAKGGLVFAAGERGSAALRSFHAQMIDHARQVLTSLPPSERWVHGLTLAFQAHREPEARAVLEAFVFAFNDRFSAADGEGDRVMQLNLQLFSLAKMEDRS